MQEIRKVNWDSLDAGGMLISEVTVVSSMGTYDLVLVVDR